MHKKLIMACMAIAAFAAFVVAPAASASPVLTSGGVTVPVGTSITGSATDTLFTGSGGVVVTCTTAHLVGTVTEDTGTSIAGEIEKETPVFKGTGTGEDCTGLGSVKPVVTSKLCLKTIAKTDVEFTIDGCLVEGVTKPVTFDLISTGIATCRYEVATLSGKAETGKSTITVGSQPAKLEAGGSIFCPAEGVLDMTFSVSTTSGTPITIS